MDLLRAFTSFAGVAPLPAENDLSRRYLRVVLRWMPVAMRYYNPWPGRPNCGHFFGGVYWYGLETSRTIQTLAIAASSPEYDPSVAGMSTDEARAVALRGLRYLLFTHDTGPADCVRPKESWGRTEPAGTKWGERGLGFFRESQCGCAIADLAVAVTFIRDLLGDEERLMLAAVAADYMARFAAMDPKSGVYIDTQTEENAWTALGMVACLVLLPDHPDATAWREAAQRWMFCACTQPDDSRDTSPFSGGTTVSQLCSRRFTTLPDGLAENHSVVHPNYMASGVSLSALAVNLLRLHGQTPPPHLSWRRRDCVNLLKIWCDDTGCPQPVQGMDWPYLAFTVWSHYHAASNVWLGDPDAALLERRALDVLERSSAAHGGRMVPEEVVRHCHSIQDPALMGELYAGGAAWAYLTHRLGGVGQTPSDPEDFERRQEGVCVYPHGGALAHRHRKGCNSFAWRNCVMALPWTREGVRLVGPASGTMMADLRVAGGAGGVETTTLRVREGADRAAALLVQRLAGGAVRRRAAFFSLPDGRCLTVERLDALRPVEVARCDQANLAVMNDGLFGDHPDLRGHRRIYWQSGGREVVGYAAADDSQDETLRLDGRWLNVDDRFGLVFAGRGGIEYRHLHCFRPWHAIHDRVAWVNPDSLGPRAAGAAIADCAVLWTPEQRHEDTAREELDVWETPSDVFAATVRGFLCAANFGGRDATLPRPLQAPAGAPLPLSWGATAAATAGLSIQVRLAACEPVILERP